MKHFLSKQLEQIIIHVNRILSQWALTSQNEDLQLVTQFPKTTDTLIVSYCPWVSSQKLIMSHLAPCHSVLYGRRLQKHESAIGLHSRAWPTRTSSQYVSMEKTHLGRRHLSFVALNMYTVSHIGVIMEAMSIPPANSVKAGAMSDVAYHNILMSRVLTDLQYSVHMCLLTTWIYYS